MIIAYRNFRNSVMVVYDLNKSPYGLNPISCYRLSASAIEALHLNDLSKLTTTLVQDAISQHKLSIQTFFETVDVKIHRSHLLQAFLFDHVQPNLSSFNPQMFKIGSSANYITHHLHKSTEQG